MSILITGAAGMIGRKLTERLAGEGGLNGRQIERLTLLDVVMPGLDGFDVCRRIRQDPAGRDIPVIMVTTLATREHRLHAVEAGANDFIAKPVDETELRVRSGKRRIGRSHVPCPLDVPVEHRPADAPATPVGVDLAVNVVDGVPVADRAAGRGVADDPSVHLDDEQVPRDVEAGQ